MMMSEIKYDKLRFYSNIGEKDINERNVEV
jgi:hypothetical protein